ncbi:MAG: hypothetical protein AB7H97_17925 [Pseudobdellovibrionaceae bacterium]
MRVNFYYFLNLLLLLIITVILGAIQTTLWPQLFGGLPAPILWLVLIAYLGLYRRFWESIFLVYACAACLAPYTAMSIGFYMLLLLILVALVQFAKTRIFWPGPGYFLIAVASLGVAYHVLHISMSYFFEAVPMTSLEILSRLIQILLTPMTAIPLFFIFQLIDRISHYDTLTEVGGGRL